jgi:hypothetical protein
MLEPRHFELYGHTATEWVGRPGTDEEEAPHLAFLGFVV